MSVTQVAYERLVLLSIQSNKSEYDDFATTRSCADPKSMSERVHL